MTDLAVRPLAPFGVAVSGLRPERIDVERAMIAELVQRHGLVVVERTELEAAAHVQLVECLGPILPSGSGERHSFISHDPATVLPDSLNAVMSGPLAFHHDLTYTAVPPEVLSLQALVLPRAGGATRFANGVRALAALPPELRAQLDGRRARHVYSFVEGYVTNRYRESEFRGRYFAAEHPLVRRNERTGRDVLFVTEYCTDRVLGMDPDESEALLQALFAYLYAPDNVYEHHWAPHDLVIWENQEIQHSRGDYDPRERRLLRRVTAGDADSNARHGEEVRLQLAGTAAPGPAFV